MMRPNVSSTSLTAAKKEITGNWNAKSVPIAEQVPRGGPRSATIAARHQPFVETIPTTRAEEQD